MYPDMEAELYWEYKQLIDMTASDWCWLCLPWLSICFFRLVPTKEQSWCSMRRSSMPCKGCSLDRNLWREVWTPACSFFSLASPSLSLPWSWCAIRPRCETVSRCTSMLVRMWLLKYGQHQQCRMCLFKKCVLNNNVCLLTWDYSIYSSMSHTCTQVLMTYIPVSLSVSSVMASLAQVQSMLSIIREGSEIQSRPE